MASSQQASVSVGDVRVADKDLSTASPTDFANISLGDEEKAAGKKKKVPRRILHFSDGTLEEYSTDEEEEEEEPPPVDTFFVGFTNTDTSKLSWFRWTTYNLIRSASTALAAADFCGERLAWFFGITSPKYQYYIDEYNRMKEEDEEERRREEREAEADRRRTLEEASEMEASEAADANDGGVINQAYVQTELQKSDSDSGKF